MRYTARKQNDGTYVIYAYNHLLTFSSEIVRTGVRGCNVQRTINKLYSSGLGLC